MRDWCPKEVALVVARKWSLDSGSEGAALPGGLSSVLSAHPASFTERLLTMAGFRWVEMGDGNASGKGQEVKE